MDLKIKASKKALTTNGVESLTLFVNVEKISCDTAIDDIYIGFWGKQSRATLYYNQSSDLFNGILVENRYWELINTNPNAYVWKFVGDKSNFDSSNIGFVYTYDAQGTSGFAGLTFNLYYGGTESNYSNNVDVIAHTWNP